MSHKDPTPRPPGLWMAHKDNSDAAHIDRAEQHLRELLSDPYYFEAMRRLLPKLDKLRSTRLSIRKGRLAAKYQHPAPPKRGRGAPKTPGRENLEYLLKAIEKRPNLKGLTLKENCRRLVANLHIPDGQRDAEVAALYRALRNTKRNIG